MSEWFEAEKKYHMYCFRRQPVVLVRGEGCRVWDEEGRVYLDLVGGIAVNVLGHGHPALAEAICRQARQLIHTSNLYYTIPQLRLAELLVEHSCADKAFFANSGAEVNEGAFKLARKWGKRHRNGAYAIISAQNSFHGRTLACVAATGQAKYQQPFTPLPAGFIQVPLNDLAALKQATTPETVAVLLEPVQGEGGVQLADAQYLKAVRAWCDEEGLLLIFDEIQTGMGRTGRFLAYEHYGVEPDVFTMAKGLAGGVPIGALLAKEKAAVFEPGDHASTFGGNPLACAAGVATVEILFQQGLIEHAAKLGEYLRERLNSLRARFPSLVQVRGLGLLIGFDLDRDVAGDLVARCLQKGLLINNTDPRTIRLAPPLILTAAEVDEAVDILADALAMI